MWTSTSSKQPFSGFAAGQPKPHVSLYRISPLESIQTKAPSTTSFIREHSDEGSLNNILQCYLVRDKMGVDNNLPVAPNKHDVFGDLAVAIGLALFLCSDKLMSSIASLTGDSAVSAHCKTTLNSIWKRYPPTENIRKGTSHWGKHTAQFLLDDAKLHKAADVWAGWNDGKISGPGARPAYFSHPFPHLLDGVKCLAGWSKVSGADCQCVTIPSCDTVSKDLGDKICSSFFGHIQEDQLCTPAKKMVLMCVLAKWDQLLHRIQAEPNGSFKNPKNHLLVATLSQRLTHEGIGLAEFNMFKSACQELFTKTNYIDTVVRVPAPVASSSTADYSQSPFQSELNIRPLKMLLDLVTRNTDPKVVFINFFTCNFMESYKSTPKADNKLKCKCRKIKAAIRVMVRFLNDCPTTIPTLEEAGVMMHRIKSSLLSEPSSVKHQGKHQFNEATPLCLSIICLNEALLTDKTKSWCRPFPSNTLCSFIEHVHGHKICQM